jgi:hypothetical protein
MTMHDHDDFPVDWSDSGTMRASLRAEIAATAAALIADEGLDYGSAKHKAYQRITGGRGRRIARQDLPSNEEIEDALREYQQIFQSESQPQRLRMLREKALSLMQLIADFNPAVTGAIANGTAGEHSDIHLWCFTDTAKTLGMFLLDHHIRHDAITLPHPRGRHEDVEALALHWQGELVTIAVCAPTDRHLLMRHDARGRSAGLDIQSLESRLATDDAGLSPDGSSI